MVIEADARHPVLVGSIDVGLRRRVARTALLVAAPTHAQRSTPEEVTDELVRIARRALPAMTVVPWPIPGASYVRPIGGPYSPPSLPNARIDVPLGATDVDVRAAITRFMGAINALAPDDPAAGAEIIALQYAATDCSQLDAAFTTAATMRLRRLAAALGAPAHGAIALEPLRAPLQIDGPVSRESACIDGHSTFSQPQAAVPTHASFRTDRSDAFAAPMRFGVRAAPSTALGVAAFAMMPPGDVRVRLRARQTLLTVEGTATNADRPAGLAYEYRGPNTSWRTSDLTPRHLAEIRQRLRALGIADTDIVTQLDPRDGRWYVRARSATNEHRAAIVAAIAGPAQSERDAVTTTEIARDCGAESSALADAVADATSRARRVAAGLGATFDPRPVLVEIEYGSAADDCDAGTLDSSPPTAGSRHVGGRLRRASAGGQRDVGVIASFPIAHPTLAGPIRAQPARDGPTSLTGRFGDVPPPIEYVDAWTFGQARLEARLPPQHVRFELSLGPDHRHAFRSIDADAGALLATELGASDADYRASLIPGTVGPSPAGERPAALEFAADVPYRPAATAAAANAALATALTFGYGGLSIEPASDACASIADALALDAVRAAARDIPAAARRGRLIAIDLRGPFTADGRCEPAPSGVATSAIRNATIPDVRLAAYARITYGRASPNASRGTRLGAPSSPVEPPAVAKHME